MAIPLEEDRIPAIIRCVSIESVLAERGCAPARRNGDSLHYHCPLPSHDDRDPSFTVKGETWRCWSACDRGGDVIDLVVALAGCSKREAIEALARRVGLERIERSMARQTLSEAEARELLYKFTAARRWHSRAVEKAGLHVVLDTYGRPRVRFPYLYDDDVVWHQDRAFDDVKPKWLSPKAARPAIFNANALRLPRQRDGELWILEGPSDVMALCSTYKAPAAIGIPGSGNFRIEWVAAFDGLERVVVVGDNDAAGEKFRARIEELLCPVVGTVVQLRIPELHNDLDEWRRASGTVEPESFGRALEAAAFEAERNANAA